MKLGKLFSIAIIMLFISISARADDWTVDTAHSSAQFSVRHLLVSNVRGAFSKVTGLVNYDGKDLTKATVEATIDASTIDTREPKRDALPFATRLLWAGPG